MRGSSACRSLIQTEATVLVSEARGVHERAQLLDEAPARGQKEPSITRRDRGEQQGCNRGVRMDSRCREAGRPLSLRTVGPKMRRQIARNAGEAALDGGQGRENHPPSSASSAAQRGAPA